MRRNYLALQTGLLARVMAESHGRITIILIQASCTVFACFRSFFLVKSASVRRDTPVSNLMKAL